MVQFVHWPVELTFHVQNSPRYVPLIKSPFVIVALNGVDHIASKLQFLSRVLFAGEHRYMVPLRVVLVDPFVIVPVMNSVRGPPVHESFRTDDVKLLLPPDWVN